MVPSCSREPESWGRSIAFEASVAGGIPIIANFSQCPFGESDSIVGRNPERDLQFYRHTNGRVRIVVSGRGSQSAKNWGTPKPIRQWMSMERMRRKSWRFWHT